MENIEMYNKIQETIRKATEIYTTPLIYPGLYPIKDSEISSGTFISIEEKMGILTNYHVAKTFITKRSKSITVPFSDKESKELIFKNIIFFPHKEDNANSPDLAFIALDDIACKIVSDVLHKKFFAIKKLELPFLSKRENTIWSIYGFVAEGKKNIKNKTLYFPNSGSYIVVPDLDNITENEYVYSDFTRIVDLIICPIKRDNRNKLPNSFEGMSGAALWKTTLKNTTELLELKITGIATMQKENQIICQGPKILYDFVEHCKQID